MNKGLLIAAIIAVVVALGGGAFVLNQRNAATPSAPPTTTVQTQTPAAQAQSDSKSLKDLFSLGSNQQCSFKDQVGNSGTVYITNGKMRGDFVTTAAQGTTNSHTIITNNTAYLWMDGQTTGFKMAFDANAQANVQENMDTLDFDQKVDYNCSAWTVSESVFTLPSGVNFTYLGAFTIPPVNPSATGASKAVQCAYCNTLPADLQPTCKAQLACD